MHLLTILNTLSQQKLTTTHPPDPCVMASIITKHLEYVAQLEAQLYGSPYYAFAEHTAALAKRALETELVRLEENTTENTTADTWTSHIKTLDWLLKLPQCL